MKVVFDERQLLHDPQVQFFAGKLQTAPEQPSRAEKLLAAAIDSGFAHVRPTDHGLDPILAVHDADYVDFLRKAAVEWSQLDNGGRECVPHVHPVRYSRGLPSGILGKAGYYMNGTNCPIGQETFEAAYWSAQTAISAADEILSGDPVTYGLCRPPGHHAHGDLAGGFCFLNNAAIAAQRLLTRYQRVAIIDIDVHHGNGTQEIFYSRNDVFCGSVHADPSNFYPFYQGYSGEKGEGVGEGWNLNIPLAQGAGNTEVVLALDQLCRRAKDLGCQIVVVALGLDAFKFDPMGKFKVTTAGFKKIALRFHRMGLPLLLIQEGGYDGPHLGENLKSFLSAFASRPGSIQPNRIIQK